MQSMLSPAGRQAEIIAELWWWMAGGAALIWLAVMALAAYAVFARPKARLSPKAAHWLIIGGGGVFPVVVLTVLLVYSLPMMPKLVPSLAGPASGPSSGQESSFRIKVVGLQWWWRVTYRLEDGREIPLANEIRLPVGQEVRLDLSAPDVIHSFWVPALAGKMDMIPGRVTHTSLHPTRIGRFRGSCAEYCGASHAFMNFPVVVMEDAEFRAWLARQAQPARPPASEMAERGQNAFLAYGCGACHAVRGTRATGEIGPDLTHIGGRLTIAAGLLPNNAESLRRWITQTHHLKPEAKMPAFDMLDDGTIAAIAVYLDGLI